MSDAPPAKKAKKDKTDRKGKKQQQQQQQDAGSKPVIGQAALRVLENPAFATYYKSQLQLDDAEWEVLEASLRSPLPVTWRFSGYDENARLGRARMESALLPSLDVVPHALPWYPDRLAWQFDVSRAALRGKDWTGADAPGGEGRSQAVKEFHQWLLRETDLGRVQRQEAVSMVPALVLDVRPGHAVLDSCASPGSKTQQILELLAAPAAAGEPEGAAAAGVPQASGVRGLLVANDADIKRCHLLASRASRLNSPSLVVTNHDARLFPEMLYERADAESGAAARPLRFDRVLCDVPCSGDGTLRKNPLIWKRWTAAAGNQLHSLQLQIACKGARLLKVGGRLVYSTCSLNPIENEAVVTRLLTTFGSECLELVDIAAELPGLARRRGLSSWRVWHRGQWHEDYASVEERFPQKCPTKLESLFVPVGVDVPSLHLERCVRLAPQDQVRRAPIGVFPCAAALHPFSSAAALPLVSCTGLRRLLRRRAAQEARARGRGRRAA